MPALAAYVQSCRAARGTRKESGGVPEDDAGTLAEERLEVKHDGSVVARALIGSTVAEVYATDEHPPQVFPPVGGALAEIWRTEDYEGRAVVLTTEGRAHILQRQSTMAGRLDEVRLAIERPTLVARDATYLHRECHYRQTPDGQGLIKVVVNYQPIPPQGTWLGEVVTVYPVDHPKRKVTPLWP